MDFVKIGNTWYNPRLITDIRRGEEGSYTLYFAAPQQKGKGSAERVMQARSISFRGEEAELFEEWLSEHEVTPSGEDADSSGESVQDRVGF